MGEGGEGEGEGEGEAYEIPKTPEPKEWVCLGSDLEILDSYVHTSRPLVSACVCVEQQLAQFQLLFHKWTPAGLGSSVTAIFCPSVQNLAPHNGVSYKSGSWFNFAPILGPSVENLVPPSVGQL